MLRPADVLEKTDKGHDELRTRQYKLPAKMRALLLMVDGNQAVGGLQEEMTGLGFAEDALDGLVEQGFLQVRGGAAPVAAPVAAAPAEVEPEPVSPDVTPFAALRRLMNESVHKTLGLKGFFFTLKIEKSSNIEDLRELFPEYETLMKKALSEETAELFLNKARSLLA